MPNDGKKWKEYTQGAAETLNNFILALEAILKEAAKQAGDDSHEQQRFRIILGTALGNAALTVNRLEQDFKAHPAILGDMHGVVQKIDQGLARLKVEDIDQFISNALVMTRDFKQKLEHMGPSQPGDLLLEITQGMKNVNELVAWYKGNKIMFFGSCVAFIVGILTLAIVFFKLLVSFTR